MKCVTYVRFEPMSYPSDPENYSYSAPAKACGACYDPGESPEQLIISISALLKGPLAAGGDPSPPNGSFLLTAAAACHWTATINGIDFDLNLGPANTTLLVDNVGGLTFFNGATVGTCKQWFINTLINPAADKYYNGWALIANPSHANGESVADLMQLIGFPAAIGTAVSPRAMAAKFATFVLARDSDNSNVHIKRDIS